MTAIERAEALLEAATDGPWLYACLTLERIRRWMRRNGAQRYEEDTRLAAMAPDLLRGYIDAVKALGAEHDCRKFAMPNPEDCGGEFCISCIVFADFERLFPEETSESAD